jgi:CHAD domain-containing protein/CYTH domain-containing protein
MDVPSSLLDRPAAEGARRLALTQLDAAWEARGRVRAAADPEALHDYRVALRRLRSCLRSYRRELRSTVTRKSRRRLDRLARATSRSRDLEVHLAWLEQEASMALEPELPGIAALTERLQDKQRRARQEMLSSDEHLLPSVHDRLLRQLSRYPATVRLDSGETGPSTAAATRRHIRTAARRLRRRLGCIEDGNSEAEIHRARIAAKHLRYLLEPFAGVITAGEAIIERLKLLQDVFGDVHDAHVFLPVLGAALSQARRARSTSLAQGLRSLQEALRARGAEAFAAAEREWLQPCEDAFFDEVDGATHALERRGRQGREVERKYLLRELPPAAAESPSVEIEQGYLPGERLVERLRRIRGDDGEELVRTLKEGSGLVRLEVEESVTPEVFDALWPATEPRRLRKRRYRVGDGDLTWEIDQFLDRDLVLAEVELPSAETEVTIPDWLSPSIEREVTDDPAYGNAELSRRLPGETRRMRPP